MIDAGRFVEHARQFQLVKPQTWFDSPAVYLPLTNKPEDIGRRQEPEEGEQPGQQDGDNQPDTPTPTPPEPQGSFITSDGVASTFVVTQDMLDGANFERLEHVTVRVWITHERRGDVELDLRSPAGVVSVLARARRFDEDADGFLGWKFMTLKHWYVATRLFTDGQGRESRGRVDVIRARPIQSRQDGPLYRVVVAAVGRVCRPFPRA